METPSRPISASDQFPHLAVNAIIPDARCRILLTRRTDNGLWCLPGGYVEVGETASEAIVREVREEIQITIRPVKLSGLYGASNRGILPPAKYPIIVAAFVCEVIAGEVAAGDEVAEFAYFDVGCLPQLVPNQRQRIVDGLANQASAVFD